MTKKDEMKPPLPPGALLYYGYTCYDEFRDQADDVRK
jgi:hypothetical protein